MTNPLHEDVEVSEGTGDDGMGGKDYGAEKSWRTILLALCLHSIPEGMAIYALAQDGVDEAILLSLGIVLHNIPLGMSIVVPLLRRPGGSKLSKVCSALFITLWVPAAFILGGILR